MLEDLTTLADGDPVASLLEAIEVGPNGRASLDRSRRGVQSMNVETLDDALLYRLSSAYDAEGKLADFFDDLVADADRDDLADAFAERRDHARTRADRLEAVFEALGAEPTTKRNRAVDGLLAARQERRESLPDGSVAAFDLGTAVAAERVQRRCYEELCALAERIDGASDAVDALERTADEERDAVEALEAFDAATV